MGCPGWHVQMNLEEKLYLHSSSRHNPSLTLATAGTGVRMWECVKIQVEAHYQETAHDKLSLLQRAKPTRAAHRCLCRRAKLPPPLTQTGVTPGGCPVAGSRAHLSVSS